MKGGKAGRPRKSGANDARRQDQPRGKAPKSDAPRPASVAPKKGSRKKPHYGGTSTSGEE